MPDSVTAMHKECIRNDAKSAPACYRNLHRYKYQLLEPYAHRTGVCDHSYESQVPAAHA